MGIAKKITAAVKSANKIANIASNAKKGADKKRNLTVGNPNVGRVFGKTKTTSKAAHDNMMNAIKQANAEGGYKKASKGTRENYLRAMNRLHSK